MSTEIIDKAFGKKDGTEAQGEYAQFIDADHKSHDDHKFDIQYESLRKAVVRTSFIAVLINFFLMVYVGPDPWATHLEFQSDEDFVIFLAWDTMIAACSVFLLVIGLHKITTTRRSRLLRFMTTICVCTLMEAFTTVFVFIERDIDARTAENICIRLVVISIDLVVLNAAKGLDNFLKSKGTFENLM